MTQFLLKPPIARPPFASVQARLRRRDGTTVRHRLRYDGALADLQEYWSERLRRAHRVVLLDEGGAHVDVRCSDVLEIVIEPIAAAPTGRSDLVRARWYYEGNDEEL
jgi:hypothetical protein